jgi:hypothetical protein
MPVRKFRMRGGGGGSGGGSCPPGVWCMDNAAFMLGLVVVVALVVGAVVYLKYYAPQQQYEQKAPIVVVRPQFHTPMQAPPMDPRFAPMSPEQSYNTPPDMRGFPSRPMMAGGGAVPINTTTRGIPDTFQQIGVLTAPGGTATSGHPNRTILPLFGRSIDNRNRWNYYTRTDGMNPVQVPVQFKRRNCDDDVGCEEVTEGDSVGVPVMGQTYTASIYRYSTPRYLPVV